MTGEPSVARILLVDDDPLFRRALCRSIRALRLSREVACREACDGAEALAAIEEHAPALVLLDYQMPGLSGVECLRRIRELRPELPVVMLTGEGDERVAVEAMKAGAMEYLVKGDDTPESLRRAISNALQKGELLATVRRQREELAAAERQRVMIESLGAACHHLGQPATVLRAYLELIRREPLSPAAAAMVDECLRAADALADVLGRLRAAGAYRTVPYLADPSGADPLRILDV